MASIGTQKNLPTPDSGQKKAQKPRTTHGLETPESTPGPDDARIIADTVRQKENLARPALGLATPESTPGPDEGRIEADKARQSAKAALSTVIEAPSIQSKPAYEGDSVPPSPDTLGNQTSMQLKHGRENEPHKYTDAQKSTVDRILACGPKQYYKILDLEETSPKEDIVKAYKELRFSTHPDKNGYEKASDAFKRVSEAGKALGLPEESFAQNAYVESDNNDDSNDDNEVQGPDGTWHTKDGSDPMDGVESTLPPPDKFRQGLYSKATPHLKELMKDPDNVEAQAALKEIDEKIKEQNRLENWPQEMSLINSGAFIGHFKTAKPFVDILKKDPSNASAKEKFDETNSLLRQLIERHCYPSSWIMNLPDGAKPKESETETSPTPATKSKSWKPGLTRKGEPILAYRNVGRGHQFIVQTGTKENPLYDLRSGAEVGHKAGDGYLNMGKDQVVLLGKADKKYSRGDAESFKEIVGIASKPIQTKSVGTGFRYPVASVLAAFETTNLSGAVTEHRDFIFRTTLRKILGKTDADQEIEEYYADRGLTPPWEVAPVKTRGKKMKAGKARKKVAQAESEEDFSDDSFVVEEVSEDESTEPEDDTRDTELARMEVELKEIKELLANLTVGGRISRSKTTEPQR